MANGHGPTTDGRGQIVKPEQAGKNLLALVERNAPALKALAPRGTAGIERFVRVLAAEVRRVPALGTCDPMSFLAAFSTATSLGLEIGSHKGEAWILPFRDERSGKVLATLIIGYRGLLALGYRSGDIATFEGRVVREGDDFDFCYGANPKLEHRPRGDGTAPVTCAYAIVRMKSGEVLTEVMSVAEIEAVRKRSRAKSGPWFTDYEMMCRKTVLRRIARFAPTASDLIGPAITLDDKADAGEDQALDVPFEVAGLGEQIEEAARANGRATPAPPPAAEPAPRELPAETVERVEFGEEERREPVPSRAPRSPKAARAPAPPHDPDTGEVERSAPPPPVAQPDDEIMANGWPLSHACSKHPHCELIDGARHYCRCPECHDQGGKPRALARAAPL